MSARRKPNRPPPARPVTERIVEAAIDSIGARGDGLATAGGVRLYVPLTVPGDRVRVRLGAARGDGVAAELVELLSPGPDRASPPCPHFGACGGCAVQHLAGPAYGRWKHDLVRAALARAGLGAVPVAETVPTPPAGRRRAVFAARRAGPGAGQGGRVLLGFNERANHRLVDLRSCAVLVPELAALVPRLRSVLASVLPDGGALDATAMLLDGGIDLVLTGGAEPGLAAREALAGFAEAADLGRLSWRPNDRRPAEPVAHRRPVTASFGGVPVAVPPGAFLQASAAGEAALTDAVRRGIGAAGRIADLFAGCGTFTFPLASGAAVHAVEGDAAALAALTGAARPPMAGAARPPLRITAERRDLFEDPLSGADLDRFDAVLFDPPRAGAAAQAAALARSAVPAVVGVSCNPASFARDARTLVDGGYRLESVTPVDQFVWSAHVELVGVFRR